jgi:cobalt/nickel transport protein
MTMIRILPLLFVVIVAGQAGKLGAHFQVLLPNADVIGPDNDRRIRIEAVFTHPMENGPVMDMGPPRRFAVIVGEEQTDLMPALRTHSVDGKQAYRAEYRFRQPGDHLFFLEPAPYWEPAEQKMLIHYTKVVVDVMGGGGGWDRVVGLPVEIEPLVRPYGLWAGNTFRGIVRHNGQPVPFAEVEVEYLNRNGTVQPPNEALVTQVVKADAHGVFSYTIPWAGWWGFAALVEADQQMPNPEGERVDVELGALIWVQAAELPKR